MIASIRGTILDKNDKYIVIENNNLGYKVHASLENLLQNKKGDEIFLWIHTHVREDMLDLYGFQTKEELEFFEMLINVSGIGPKGALGILSLANISTIKKAISSNDTSYLTKVSGIGRKTAERLIIELKDKIKEDAFEVKLQEEIDAIEALQALGYSQYEARDALKNIEKGLDTNQKIKEALKNLSQK